MFKIDPAFLFEIGDSIRGLRSIDSDTDLTQAYVASVIAVEMIEQAFTQSVYAHVFRLPAHVQKNALLAHIKKLNDSIEGSDDWEGGRIPEPDLRVLQQRYAAFETLFLAELQSAPLYMVVPKSGFDTTTLIEGGQALFSSELASKVPDSIADLQQATRCIAFELPTAAGFHLHRAHESVLRIYWDCVTGGAPRPKENNMGVYLAQLDKLDKGRKDVRSHLRSIKDFHRNPLMHPEQSLENSDEAIDLLSAIRSSIGYMLKEIPGNDPPMLAAMDAS